VTYKFKNMTKEFAMLLLVKSEKHKSLHLLNNSWWESHEEADRCNKDTKYNILRN